QRALTSIAGRRPFRAALESAGGPAIIAEMKRASPSVGLIARNFDPAEIARVYERAGADCISVLTENDHFLGDLSYLDLARRSCLRPILRKDFLSTRYEMAQSAAYGADAALLIVAELSDEQLRVCLDEAAQYALDVLVEVHDAKELARALDCGAGLIGINNRDLRTFETDLAVSEYLLPSIPPGVTAVSESGMHERGDIVRLQRAGARAFLVGEALMRAEDPAALIASLKSSLLTMQ
ncbi:MAG TPA: indole-3-glycerol phosphate synthase TrpC, partial [Candidatus Baltobacteraceae bacterium]|nr:indole-3-glycerol phosphate synthase TrpC [Candidatus Baltobacteraceae bacterium]